MNVPQAKRFFWKEYRTQRGLWLGIVVIIVILQGLMFAVTPVQRVDFFEGMLAVGVILTSFYALASASVLFAGEREETTDRLLMTLPVSTRSLFVGKFSWMLTSWLCGAIVTALTAALIVRNFAGIATHEMLDLIAGMLRYGGSMVAWGLFFSVICRRVYSTLACATIAFLISSAMIQFVAGLMDLLTIVALVGSVVVGRHWLSSDRLVALPQFGVWADRFNLERALSQSIEASPGWKLFRRQLWLEWRNARVLFLSILGFSITLISINGFLGHPSRVPAFYWIVFGLLPLFLGISSCLRDQHHERYRFLSNRGAAPEVVWAAKHLTWAGLWLLTMLPFLYLPLLGHYRVGIEAYLGWNSHNTQFFLLLPIPENTLVQYLQERYLESAWPAVSWFVSLGFLTYLTGHICSLLIKRSVSAALIAVVFSLLVFVHLYAALVLQVPLIIAVGIPSLLLCVFSLWRMSGWLEERNTRRDGLTVAGLLLLIVLLSISSWGVWRIAELTLVPAIAGLVAICPIFGLFDIDPLVASLVIVSLMLMIYRFRNRLTVPRLLGVWSILHVNSAVIFLTAYAYRIPSPDISLYETWNNQSDAVETGNEYRELDKLITPDRFLMPPEALSLKDDEFEVWRKKVWLGQEPLPSEQLDWLAQNQPLLERVIQNTQEPLCAPGNPFDTNSSNSSQQLTVAEMHGVVRLLRLNALQLENEQKLEDARKLHTAILRLYRHQTQRQYPQFRSWGIGELNRYLEQDFVRWIKRPQQTPERLLETTREFIEILNGFFPLEHSFHLEITQQQWAVEQRSFGSWANGTVEFKDWLNLLDQLLHQSFWERTRAMLMLQQIEARQQAIFGSINDSTSEVIYELAATDEIFIDHLDRQILPLNRYPYDTSSNAFWRRAAATPVIQANYREDVQGFGGGQGTPNRNEWILFGELKFQRRVRLTLLALTIRSLELEGGTFDSLEQLAKLEVPPITVEIRKLAGNHCGDEDRYFQPISVDNDWQNQLLYHDPVSRSLFNPETLNRYLRKNKP